MEAIVVAVILVVIFAFVKGMVDLKSIPQREEEYAPIVNSPYRDTMRQSFIDYMNSDMWQGVRLKVINRDKGKCRKCRKKGNTVHHTNYRYWGCGDRFEVSDCVLLCPLCHDKEHITGSVDVPFFAKRLYEGGGYGSDTPVYHYE